MKSKYKEGDVFLGIVFNFLLITISFFMKKYFFDLSFKFRMIFLIIFLIVFLLFSKKLKTYSIVNDNFIEKYYSKYRICANILNTSVFLLYLGYISKGSIYFLENSFIFILIFIGIFAPLFLDKFME